MECINAQVFRSICPWPGGQFVLSPSVGTAGEIFLCWNSSFWQKFDEFVGCFFVSVLFKNVRRNVEWVATSVYGPNNASDRASFLLELSQVAVKRNKPWVLGADFNVIRFPHEKKGGCVMSTAMMDFSDWIRQYGLVDLPLGGAVMSRLDRFLVSTSWLELFPDCLQKALAKPVSDQCPLLLETDFEDWGPPPFRLELMWFLEKDFSKCVNECWVEKQVWGWMGFQLTQKLKFLKQRLKCWRKEVLGNVQDKKNHLLDEIQSIDMKVEVGFVTEEDKDYWLMLQEEFCKFSSKKKLNMRQRSRN